MAGSCRPNADIELNAVDVHFERFANVRLRFWFGGWIHKPDASRPNHRGLLHDDEHASCEA